MRLCKELHIGWLTSDELDHWLAKYQDPLFAAEDYIWFEGKPLFRLKAARLLEGLIRKRESNLHRSPELVNARVHVTFLFPFPLPADPKQVIPDLERTVSCLKTILEIVNNPAMDLSWFAVDNGQLKPFAKAAADWLKKGIQAKAQAQQAAFQMTFTTDAIAMAAAIVIPGVQAYHLVGWKTMAWSVVAAGGFAAFMTLTDQLIEKYIEGSRAEIDYGEILLNASVAGVLAIPLAPLGPFVERCFVMYPKPTLATVLGLQTVQTTTDVTL